jgi:hypothetical protein
LGERGRGEPRLGVPAGEERKRGKAKEDVVGLGGLRLNDILEIRYKLGIYEVDCVGLLFRQIAL